MTKQCSENNDRLKMGVAQSAAPPGGAQSLLTSPVVLGAGPVGRAVAAELSNSGLVPTVVTRSGRALDGAVTRSADIADTAAARAAIDGASVVFQCAQPAYHRWEQDFRPMQDAVLTACAAADAALVVVDNAYAYGQTDAAMTETSLLAPTSRKGAVRAAAHRDLDEAHRAGRVRTATVRSSDFIGPHVTQSAFGERCLGALARGRKAQLLGPAHHRHSVTFIPDVAQAMVRVAADDAHFGRTWHAPTAPAWRVDELIVRAAEIAGVDARSSVVPRWLLRAVGLLDPGARATVEMLYQFDRDFIFDSQSTEEELGLAPTALDDALTATMRWYDGLGS